jgi:hypothetical protein
MTGECGLAVCVSGQVTSAIVTTVTNLAYTCLTGWATVKVKDYMHAKALQLHLFLSLALFEVSDIWV